jgi:hypothetical protein
VAICNSKRRGIGIATSEAIRKGKEIVEKGLTGLAFVR